MADLISRKALMDAFRVYMVEHFDKDKCAKVGNCEVCEKKCLWHEVVASVPAVDAVEVVHGHWEYGKWEQGHWVKGNERCRCSVCHRDFAVDNSNIWHGCPQCLAKMDGERREENAAD